MSSRTYSRRRRLNQDNDIDSPKQVSATILGPFDKWLFFIILILTAFGLLMIFSASGPDGARIYNDPFYFLKKQIFFDILGFVLMIVLSRLDYNVYKNICIPFSIVVIFLIGLTYVLGVNLFGGERWLKVGPLTFQPSEFGKMAAIFLMADAMAHAKHWLTPKFIINSVIIGFMVILILKQPSLSIAMITSVSTLSIMFMGGFPILILAPLMGVASWLVVHVINSTEYQKNRVLGWLDPWADPQNKGYNIIQSWYAFGSGGIFGLGYGNSKQKLFYLPFRHTDFIFAVIAEELGLIGVLILIAFFVGFILRGLYIAENCENKFGKLLAIGITCAIAFQAFVNMGVASGVLPPTGVTLPLISYGGSSSLAIFCMLGILLNISRKRIKRIVR